MQIVSKKVSIRRNLSPLRKEDRIEAILSTYTSDEKTCPFYACNNPNVRSKCLIDPKTWRTWDCKGICFFQGLCCSYLSEELKNSNFKREKSAKDFCASSRLI